MRHDIKRKDPKAKAKADADRPPRQERSDDPCQRTGDEQVAERIEHDADDGVNKFRQGQALKAENGLNQRRRLQRSADEQRRDRARPEFPDDIGRRSGENGRRERPSGQGREKRGIVIGTGKGGDHR